jgi:hypothetical protein
MKHFERLALLAAICTLGACSEKPDDVKVDVKTAAATDVTDKSAVCGGTLRITLQGNADKPVIQETGVAWATTEALLLRNSGVSYVLDYGKKEGNFSCKLEGLTPNATYYFRAYASYLQDAGALAGEAVVEYGEVSKFTTLLPAGIKLVTLPVTGIAKTSAVAGGNITAVGRPPYTERGVCYSNTSREPDIANHLRKPSPGEGTGEYTVTLTGLTEGAIYYVRAYATNGVEVAYGQTESFVAGGTLAAGGAATVALSDYVAISDGIYYYFAPSSNTKTFYWNQYSAGELPGSDEAIVADMLTNGVEVAKNETPEGYGYDLQENTIYTLCMFAVDNENQRGALSKRVHTTKFSANQPKAAITISSISNRTVYNSITKNSYCSSYAYSGMINLDASHLSVPDIHWASYCYEDYKKGDFETTNFTNASWSDWPANSTCAIITLGFTSSGVNSGVIDIKFFSTATNSVIPRSVATSPLLKRAETKVGKAVSAAKNNDKQIFLKPQAK